MTDSDLHQAIGRLRRAQPRNVDTMAVCDALEKCLSYYVDAKPMIVMEAARRDAKAKFDKKAYQRELMRKRRAAVKTL